MSAAITDRASQILLMTICEIIARYEEDLPRVGQKQYPPWVQAMTEHLEAQQSYCTIKKQFIT